MAAAIQVVQVEFADADLLIIPSNVLIDVELSDDPKPQYVQLPDNGKLAWKVTMPKKVPKPSDEEYQAYLVGIVLMVLGQATALPVSKFDELVNERLERDLLGRVFSVRPLRELMKFAQPDNVDLTRLASETRPDLRREFQPIEAGELKWRNGPGPGYSQSLAEEYLTNRYERTQRGLRVTLPRIVGDERCRRMLLKLRAEGVLDWQILNALFSIVAQSQVETKLGDALSSPADAKHMNDRSLRAEQASDPEFDLDVLTDERASGYS